MGKVPDAEFDLRAAIRQVAEETSLRGPADISEKVIGMIPRAAVPKVLRLVLPEFVRQVLQDERQGRTSATGAKNSARSPMQKRIREAWKRMLAGQFHVGSGTWKQLGECSYDDVMFLAAERMEAARRTAATGAMFEELAAAMQKAGVDRAGELPEETLARVLTVEAAA